MNDNTLNPKHLALALFSGGLDSILAAKVVQRQGLEVQCLHFVTPFFGAAQKIPYWKKIYGLNIEAIDVGPEMVKTMVDGPPNGFGSVLNPCVDCKIIMLRKAAELMRERGAACIVTGEVLGQRPMSQRRDTLNIIQRDASLKGDLLRPLCAKHLDPTRAELAGIIDREALYGFSGRGRSAQKELAEEFGITEFPNPAGGCLLTEKENARNYWPVLRHCPQPSAEDFYLSITGRQFWHHREEGEGGRFWLTVGRNQADNQRIQDLAQDRDLLFKAKDFPGPISLGRDLGFAWDNDAIAAAAAFTASFSPKAMRHAEDTGESVTVRVHKKSLDAPGTEITVIPSRDTAPAWTANVWEDALAGIRALRKA